MKPLDESAQDVLRAGRAAEAPSTLDRERVRGKLAIALAAGAAGPAIAAPVATAAAKWWASKAVIGVVSASVVAVSAAVVVTRVRTPAPAIAPPPVAQPVAAAAEDDREDLAVDEADEGAVTPPPTSTTPPGPTPAKKVRRKKKPAVQAVEPPTPLSTPPPQQVEPAKQDDTLEAETQGLRDVHAALRAKDSARALTLLEDQDRRFPLGQLRPEREAARVLALCASDAQAGAAALAHFVERHPGSPLLPRLRAACPK